MHRHSVTQTSRLISFPLPSGTNLPWSHCYCREHMPALWQTTQKSLVFSLGVLLKTGCVCVWGGQKCVCALVPLRTGGLVELSRPKPSDPMKSRSHQHRGRFPGGQAAKVGVCRAEERAVPGRIISNIVRKDDGLQSSSPGLSSLAWFPCNSCEVAYE